MRPRCSRHTWWTLLSVTMFSSCLSTYCTAPPLCFMADTACETPSLFFVASLAAHIRRHVAVDLHSSQREALCKSKCGSHYDKVPLQVGTNETGASDCCP